MNDILKTQQSFARKALAQKEHRFEDLYHLICREDWIRTALQHVLSNKGARTPGIDGINREDLKTEEQQADFVESLQKDLKSGAYQPMPVKREWIDKPGKREKRGLGIPTVRDRVVQELLRILMEPIWESDFLNCSYGFRKGRRTMDCIAVFRSHVTTLHKYYWVIEGDIRKCFDRINHRILLKLVCQRIADQRIVALIAAHLKAGIMEDGLLQKTSEGTPQGGILSPLLANIYLHQLDLWWWQKFGCLTPNEKRKRRSAGLGKAILVRYADDFVILWNGTHQDALDLRDKLKRFLWEELHLELSEEKTHVTHAMDGLDFLGFHIEYKTQRERRPILIITPTEKNIQRFKAKIKALTRRNTILCPVEMRFEQLNRIIRGWGNYYRHVNFTRDASKLDWWIPKRVRIWLKAKHRKGTRWILRRYLKREITGKRNRNNFVVKDGNGEQIFLAKLSDISLTHYYRRKIDHPYLGTEVVPTATEPETPFLETGPSNIGLGRTEWIEIRKLVKERDEYRCTECGKPATVTQLDVHHREALKDGGTHNPDNLVTLCRDCHEKTPSYGQKKLNGK